RYRPVSITQWLLTKYLVGLAIVLFSCILPLILERLLSRRPEDQSTFTLVFFPFSWTALYSIGFLCGALVRRTAHAAMLALAAMLLLYFLPMILPPLAWLSMANLGDEWRRPGQTSTDTAFIAAMLTLAL